MTAPLAGPGHGHRHPERLSVLDDHLKERTTGRASPCFTDGAPFYLSALSVDPRLFGRVTRSLTFAQTVYRRLHRGCTSL